MRRAVAKPRAVAAALASGVFLGAVLGGCLAGCAAPRAPIEERAVRVVTGFYPLEFVVEQLGGDRVEATNLAQPGAEPHDLELRPRQMASIADADLVVYLGSFQPAVDEAVALEASGRSLDVASLVPLLDLAHQHEQPEAGHDREGSGKDPHLWLDPMRLAQVATAVADRLAAIDPNNAEGYRDRAVALHSELSSLDREYHAGLAGCERHEIVVSHAAFGYLAQRYGLDQIALSGLSPEGEPTPQRLAEVASAAQTHGATTIFFESLVSPRVAQAIAAEVGAATAVLDPIEGEPEDGDYLAAMRANLDALRAALGCG